MDFVFLNLDREILCYYVHISVNKHDFVIEKYLLCFKILQIVCFYYQINIFELFVCFFSFFCFYYQIKYFRLRFFSLNLNNLLEGGQRSNLVGGGPK